MRRECRKEEECAGRQSLPVAIQMKPCMCISVCLLRMFEGEELAAQE